MMLRDIMMVGEAIEMGTYEFTAERIVEFASQFDPQFFHLDAEKAKNSVLGGLCASGWHISAAMMKCNVEAIKRQAKAVIEAGGVPPKIGPSPGFKNMKWLKPVYAGDTVTYSMRFTRSRPVPYRPGRNIVEISYEGLNQKGDLVFTVEASVVEFE
ncbi:MaoC family dehydratase [Rhizobium sp. TH2]|uniref:MaoC family dehydratase n=1 Tax=Rhizobium sp. TH2 TaxID=2775403 RepID=UPI0021575978|nr:MaoC family dehydratase [Rhizobium sp. TH2]UVC07073.1 MaoC family dehydratase [Rhizobium sp. TH2]